MHGHDRRWGAAWRLHSSERNQPSEEEGQSQSRGGQQPGSSGDAQAKMSAEAAAAEKAGMVENLNRAAKLIDEMLEEVMRELFAEQARGAHAMNHAI